MSSHALLVLTTIGSAADARTLVTRLVEVPELLAFPAERGSDLYLSWLTSEVMA